MKLLLYGGTFDPPHNGHLHNLAAAIKAVCPDTAIVMPAGIPPHKQASATPAALRLAMCAAFRAVAPCVTVSDWELSQQGRSYTVNTLEMLHARHPGAQLYLCVGSDMLQTFTQWHRWREILALAALVVQSRQNGDAPALRAAAQTLERQGGRVILCDAPAVECASSEVRAALRAGAAPAALTVLPPPVPAIIRHCRLYQTPKEAPPHDL